MSSFEGIKEFIAVAEAKGFSAAARNLEVSTSHVSRRIAALEARLGAPLVARSTRHVRLTEAGELYYQRCLDLVNDLDEANRAVSPHHLMLSGTLRVSAAGEFAEHYLTPALLSFAKEHPKLSIHMDFNARFVNIVEEGVDFAVRYGKLTGAGQTARKLVDRGMIAMASREYLERKGIPQTPEALADHDCLLTNRETWSFARPGSDKAVEVRVSGRWRANSGRCIVAACRAGLGIAYMPRSSYGAALSDGSLVPVLEAYTTMDYTTWLVYSDQKHLSTRARLAIEFLLDHFKTWREDPSS